MLAAYLAALALASSPPYDDAGYLAVADRLQPIFEPLWDERAGNYRVPGGGVGATSNANLLLVHSVAALRGHRGPARQDHRARLLVDALLESPPYAATPPPRLDASSQWHAPGWVSSMRTLRSGQHVMVDSEVVDGLVHAWVARRALGLSPQRARLIADRIHAVARGSFWRWPAIRLNQFSWYARIYSADAIVTGRSRLLRHDLALQIGRFARDAAGSSDRAGNLGPGLRFHYFPDRPRRLRENFDSPEYANIIASFTRFYADARRRGMRAPAHAGLYRRWLRRVLAGYWTHAGYLNWDTGLGFRRWHQAKKLGLSQQALIGIAAAPGLAGPRTRAWAKWILDQGLAFYERQARYAGGPAPGVLFGVRVHPQSLGSARLAAARIAGNAARAVAAGLGSARAAAPPPLYAFDPDTGRLAVSTSDYNTAIVPVSQRAFPYGGIELARLFDGRQEVAANIGGRPPASFGLVVRDRAGRRVLATQLPRTELGGQPLRLTRAPTGVGAAIAARRAYAGTFADLRATGTVRSGSIWARTRHRFTARSIETRWSLRGAARHSADALFPSWGRGASVTAVRRDGSRVVVGGRRIALDGIVRLCVRSERSGYAIVPLSVPARASARALVPVPQSSAPRPGPTLAIEVLRPDGGDRAAIAVRLQTGRRGDAACAR
jgi:hypothetical protein